MNVILGCEESQAVCIEFRKRGHQAYSCDLQECSGSHPEWHLRMDVFKAINGGVLELQNGETVTIDHWDLGIFFPDCTFLTISANKWYKDQPPRKSGALVGYERLLDRVKAIKFFIDLYFCGIPKVSLENPIGIMSSVFRKPDQVLQPWMFGHGETKGTCLWLKNLPKLKWVKQDNLFEQKTAVDGREQRIHHLRFSEDRAKLRSKTFPGIAASMAEQWG